MSDIQNVSRETKRLIKTYARIISKSLSTRQRALINNVLPLVDVRSSFPKYLKEVEELSRNEHVLEDKRGNGDAIFGDCLKLNVEKSDENYQAKCFPFKKLALEIGFGSGENLIYQSQLSPETLHIGAEPYLNGVVKVLSFIEKKMNFLGAEEMQSSWEMSDKKFLENNILIWADDARKLFDLFLKYNVILDNIFILYPDPWPKVRHHKKRLVNKEFLMSIARFMNTASSLYITTDHGSYAKWIFSELEYLDESFVFEYSREPKYKSISSKYEKKGIESGRMPHYFCISKK